MSPFDGVFLVDLALGDHAEEVIVKQLHAHFFAGLDDGRDTEDLVFADHVGDGAVDVEVLVGGNHAADVLSGQQGLTETGDHGVGELDADLLLLVHGELVDDTGDGALGAGGVQRAEHEVAGLGRSQGGFDGLEVAEFADEDDVRVLAKGSPQRLGETGHVHADLALADERFFVRVVVFDRVFDGDDVPVVAFVDVVDHRRQGGRLARTGRPGDQEHAPGPVEEFLDRGGQTDFVEREELGRDEPQRQGDVSAFLVDGGAKTPRFAELEPEVRPALFLEFLLGAVGGDGLHQGDGVFGIEDFGFELPKSAVKTQHGRSAHVEMEVAGPTFDTCLQKPVDLNGCHVAPFSLSSELFAEQPI